ncbi:MFS general substrate transporter [Delitschia confertaspora ATCC 74209]|uniref:MFS general substrate transporter n=1 Tax=Delitschia confertaspora ATCC 74209 TaxID=1513339 RepID=A0A9P4MZM2_9PLEO|nr:MFS general substrate transporter [Delitschia confertaspora ATCC 74209]
MFESAATFGKPSLQEWSPTRREWLIMMSLSIISLMVALDATILVCVLPTIATSLHGTSTLSFWAGTSYLLSSAVFQPVVASISFHFGRQHLVLVSLFLFTLGTILCGLSHTFSLLLPGRVIQGIGGGGIITMSQVIFCDIVPLRQRPKYFAMVLGAWAVGSLLGPVLGGAFATYNWRWIFWVNLPFCGLGFAMVLLCVRLRASEALTLREKMVRTDWGGGILFLGGMTSFLIGLSWGGVQFPWGSAATLIPIFIGLAGLGVFGWWQVRKEKYTLLPVSLFYCVSAFAAFYCAVCNGLVLFVGLYYYPFYVMSVRLSSPIRAGVELIPALAFVLPGSIVVSLITTRIGRFRWAIWGGWTVATIGAGLMLLLDRHTSLAARSTILSVFGLGAGMVLSSVNFGTQAIAKVEDVGMAASMYAFMRSLGNPLGVALAGTVFQNAMKERLIDLGLPGSIASQSEAFVSELHGLSSNDTLRIGAQSAYVHGFKAVWLVMVTVSATGGLASLWIKRFSMDRTLQSGFTVREESFPRR